MHHKKTDISDVLLFEPRIFEDARGFFFESFNAREFEGAVGSAPEFVQDNVSRSIKGVLRGLHYQVKQPQGKLVRVSSGEIYDVAVDLRGSSPTFGRWISTRLSSDNRRTLWIPPGFAHGFLVISAVADVHYKTTDFWAPEHERTLIWNDPRLAIEWPLDGPPIMSDKDKLGVSLDAAETYA